MLVPLDLKVAESTIAADSSLKRRRSDDMLEQCSVCALEVTNQVQTQLESK